MNFLADKNSDLLPSLKISLQRTDLIFPGNLSERATNAAGLQGHHLLGGCISKVQLTGHYGPVVLSPC